MTDRHAHRYIRAYLAGVALPTLVVCAAGLLIAGLFDRFDIAVQRALILPLAANPLRVSFLNSVVGLDVRGDRAARRTA